MAPWQIWLIVVGLLTIISIGERAHEWSQERRKYLLDRLAANLWRVALRKAAAAYLDRPSG